MDKHVRNRIYTHTTDGEGLKSICAAEEDRTTNKPDIYGQGKQPPFMNICECVGVFCVCLFIKKV